MSKHLLLPILDCQQCCFLVSKDIQILLVQNISCHMVSYRALLLGVPGGLYKLQFEVHFKEWMIVILSVTKKDIPTT